MVKINICDTCLISNLIKDYFKNELVKDKELFYDFITYFVINNNVKIDNRYNIQNIYDIIVSNYLYMFNVRYEYRCLGIYQNNYVYAFYLLDYAVFIKTHIYDKIYEIINSEGNIFLNLSKIIDSFINIFKANNYLFNKFDDIEQQIKKLKNKMLRSREIILLIIIKKIYINYQIYLEKNSLIDFHDMINKATKLVYENKVNFKYKYIIIDTEIAKK